MKGFFTTFIAMLLFCQISFAKEQKKEIGAWKIAIIDFMGSKACYGYSFPHLSLLYDDIRDQPYIMLERKGPGMYTFSLSPGFDMDKAKGVAVKMDRNLYELNIQKLRIAWTYSMTQDKTIVSQMKQSKNMEVRSYDLKDNQAVDRYDISSAKDAISYMERNCR